MHTVGGQSTIRNSESSSTIDYQTDTRSIRKNFIVICLIFALVFTSYNAVINLQSSVNSRNNVGLYALAINSGFSILSCLFITNPLMFLCGYKWTMFLAQIVFLLFIGVNIYPKAWLMYPVSALCGVFRSAFGTAQTAYISALGHSDQSGDDTKSTVNKYFAIFFAALQSSQIWGNLISYIILSSTANDFIPRNASTCGANYLDSEQGFFQRIAKQISMQTMVILYTTFVSLIAISLVLAATMLDQRSHSKPFSSTGLIRESLGFVTATWEQLKDRKQIFLLPLPFLVGASEAFLFGIFTNSFISCSVGVQYVGLVMITYGLSACIFSMIVAYAQKFKHRAQWCILAFVIWYALLFIMLVWKPNASQIHVLFILAGLSGVASAIWGPLLSSLHGHFFPRNEEAAFSTMVLSQNTGNLVVYFYAGLLRVRTSIILHGVYLTITMISYLILERRERHNISETSDSISFAQPRAANSEME